MKYAILIGVMLWTGIISAQHRYTDTKTMTYDQNEIQRVQILNYEGELSVKGTSGSIIVLEVSRTLESASKERLEEAIDSFFFDGFVDNGELYLFARHPERIFKIDENGIGNYNYRSWNYDWSDRDRYQVNDEYELTLKLPSKLNLVASNHHDDLTINDVQGEIKAHNHHGHLTITGAANNVNAHTHHKNIEISFIKNPDQYLYCDTHHGDIILNFPSTPSASVALQSRHGAFFTDFDYEPLEVKATTQQTKHGTKYRLNDGTMVKIGSGKAEMKFETYHGDVFIASNK